MARGWQPSRALFRRRRKFRRQMVEVEVDPGEVDALIDRGYLQPKDRDDLEVLSRGSSLVKTTTAKILFSIDGGIKLTRSNDKPGQRGVRGGWVVRRERQNKSASHIGACLAKGN